jgi:hypothetical protein
MSELIDNRAHRIRTLKEEIRHLHAGEAPEQVKPRLAALVPSTPANSPARPNDGGRAGRDVRNRSAPEA